MTDITETSVGDPERISLAAAKRAATAAESTAADRAAVTAMAGEFATDFADATESNATQTTEALQDIADAEPATLAEVEAIASDLLSLGIVLPALPVEAAVFAEFSGSKYYNAGLTSLIFADWVTSLSGTFTRGGTNHPYVNSSGLIAQAAANTPRITYDPVTLAPLGLLYEPACTNLLPFSQQLAAAGSGWTFVVTNVTLADNATNGVDGAATAGVIKETVTNGVHAVRYWGGNGGTSLTAAVNYAFQIFLKPAGALTRARLDNFATLFLGNVDINFTAKTVSDPSWSLEQWQNGWFRLWKTGAAFSANIFSFGVSLQNGSGGTSYAGNVTNGVYVGGVMLEVVSSLASKPSLYTRTTGAAMATRAADSLQITIPTGVSKLTYTFGDGTTQLVTVAPGAYTVPLTLNRSSIKSLITVDLAVVGSPVASVAGRTGAVTLGQADIAGLTTASTPTFAGLVTTALSCTFAGALFQNNGALFQWTRVTPTFGTGLRGVIIGYAAAQNATIFSNNVVIGQDAGKTSANISTAVIIGDTAAGSSSSAVGVVAIGNEAGNTPPTIGLANGNVIGNSAALQGSAGSANGFDVMGQLACRFMRPVDTVAIGWSAGTGNSGTPGSHTQSTFVGSKAGMNLIGARSGNFLLGYNVQAPTTTTDNYFNINNVLVGSMTGTTPLFTLQKPDGSGAMLKVSQLNLSNLPTSDPGVPGAVWRSGTDLKISI